MKLFIVYILILIIASSGLAADSTLVKLKVDVDSSFLFINSQPKLIDDSGNSLIKDTWFIFKLSQGEYLLSLQKAGFQTIDTSIVISDADSLLLDFKVLVVDTTIQPLDTLAEKELYYPFNTSGKVNVTITSDPDSASVIINNTNTERRTPLQISLDPSTVDIEVTKDEHEPLISNLMLELNRELNANFILRTLAAPIATPESLGMEYMPKKAIIDTNRVKEIRVRYQALSESFALFPLTQGLLAKIVVDDSQQGTANVMIVSGLALTFGTLLLGKVIAKSKVKSILRKNEENKVDNQLAATNNRNLDRLLQEANKALYDEWININSLRGKVELAPADSIKTDE